MNDRGQGYLADLAVFTIMIALACSMLIKASPVEPETASQTYATSLARSTLLALQHATTDEAGGFTYALNTPWGHTERGLRHKTFAQLLAEDAFCNLRVEVGGLEVALGTNQNLDNRVREFLKEVLDDLIGGRFSYRLSARATSISNSSGIRVYFETEIGGLSSGGHQLCSETLVMNLPFPQEWLTARIQNMCDVDSLEFEPEIAVEITLELWSR